MFYEGKQFAFLNKSVFTEVENMNILLISGSPRKNGNTNAIVQQVAEKLRSNHDVEICHITDYQINGCLGCNQCQSVLDEPGCVQHDDVSLLLNKVMNADAVLYGTPLYGHSYSGQLKLLMDRHVALFKFVGGEDKAVDEMEIKSFIEKKPVGLLVSCQGPEENNTELVQMQFRRFCESSLASCMGTYIFPWCSPNVIDSHFSEEVLNQVVCDIEALKM
ncbi:MAG: flavodoxin family protein [Ruminococcus sp.]